MTDLKPCPFCGGEAEVFEHFDECDSTYLCHWYDVGCINDDCVCGYGIDCSFKSEQEAISAWNTRTLDQESFNAGRRDAQAEIDAACAECEEQQERELLEAQKERTCTYIETGRRTPDGQGFVPQDIVLECSLCHGENANTQDGILQLANVPRWMKYCPNCGAKVVSE